MKKLNGRRLKAILILSVVAPLGLLATFRLTGILEEPPTPETITIDEARWEIERPSKDIRFNDSVENTYDDDAILMVTSVLVCHYFENAPDDAYWGRDGISFTVNANATAIQGFIASIIVEFLPSDANSIIYIIPTFSRYYNVIVTHVEGIGTSTGVTHIKAKVSGSPCSMRLPSHWVFTDKNLENHQLKVNFKVTYFNGATYQRIVAPIVLKVVIV